MKLSNLSAHERNDLNGVNPNLVAIVIMEKEGKETLQIIDMGSGLSGILQKLDVDDLRRIEESARLCVQGDQCQNDSQAADYYRKAFEVNPYNDVAIMSYGCLLAGQGKVKEGIQWVRKAIEANPLNERAKRNLAAMEADL